MKFKGIFLILILFGYMCYDVRTNAINQENIEYITINENISDSSTKLSESNNNIESLIEYVNDSNTVIQLGLSDISLNCIGSGTEKESDENLVENNMKLSIYYSQTKDGTKHSNMVVDRNEKVYIHIVKEYISDKYPVNEVACQFSIKS